MTADAINAISRLTEASLGKCRIVRADAEPPHVYYVMDPAGNLKRTEALAPPAADRAADVDTLCRVALAEPEDRVQVWYHRAGVVAVLDTADDHPPTCRLDLAPSPQLARLIDWDRAGSYTADQTELVRLLRTLFAGCVPADLVTVVRQVKANKRADVDSQQSQGKVSLSRTMIAEMTGTSAIPERLTFTVPVFAQAAVPVAQAVRVELEPDPQTERFRLTVLPGDVEAAFAAAEEVLAERIRAALANDGIPVYRGSPG